MSMTEPPEVRSASFKRSAPFVEVTKRYEERGDHAFMALMMGLSMVLGIGISSLPVAFVALLGVIGGYAFHSWLVFEDLYEVDE